MQLTYDSFALHNLGDLSISQSREYEGGDAPQRAKVTFKVKVDTFAPSHADNYLLISSLVEALRTQYGVLRWEDEVAGRTWIETTASVLSTDLPEDPNAWGTYQGEINIVFCFYEHNLNPNNQSARFTRTTPATPSATPIVLGNVTKWTEAINNDRFDPMRPQRERTVGKLTASGILIPPDGANLAERRTALQAAKTALLDEMASAEGTFVFGDFNRSIKVEECTAEIDQSTWVILWSFTASYVKFPGETYNTVRYTLDSRDAFTGEIFLTFAGKIASNSEAAARIRLGVIRTAILAQTYQGTAFTAAQPIRQESTADLISANEDGDAFTEISFTEEYRAWRADNHRVLYEGIDLGEVIQYSERSSAKRYNEMRSHRQHVAGQIAISGVWKSDPSQTTAVRRAALLAQHAAILAAVNAKDGTIKFNATEYKVRIEDFTAQLNQAIYAVEWSLTATFTRFPDETSYAPVEYTLAVRDDFETGDQVLTFAGRIMSESDAHARTKLATVRTAFLAAQGLVIEQQLRSDLTPATIDVEDGSTFIELSFSEEYRRRKSSLLSWTLRVNRREDIKSGFALVSYAGTVTASGSTDDAAYSAALTKAQSLGAGKLPFAVGSTITHDSRQVQALAGSPCPTEFVKLEFSYEYQDRVAAGNTYLEVNSETNTETFGTDTENISGSVTAATFDEAHAVYATQVLNLYYGQLILNERTSKHREQRQVSGAYPTQEVRMDFSFSVHKPKTSSSTIRYSVQTTKNYTSLEQRTVVSGSAFAADRATCDAVIAEVVTGLSLTNQVERVRTEQRDKDGTEFFMQLDFSDTFSENLTGDNAIMECEVTQELEYSGTRWVSQPIPRTVIGDTVSGGISVMQDCGQRDGRRTIRGSVTSASFSVARAWCKKQKNLLTGDLTSGSYTSGSFPEPERIEVNYVFPPHAEGFRGGDDGCDPDGSSNVRMYKINFTFSEILPNYPMPDTGLKAEA